MMVDFMRPFLGWVRDESMFNGQDNHFSAINQVKATSNDADAMLWIKFSE